MCVSCDRLVTYPDSVFPMGTKWTTHVICPFLFFSFTFFTMLWKWHTFHTCNILPTCSPFSLKTKRSEVDDVKQGCPANYHCVIVIRSRAGQLSQRCLEMSEILFFFPCTMHQTFCLCCQSCRQPRTTPATSSRHTR